MLIPTLIDSQTQIAPRTAQGFANVIVLFVKFKNLSAEEFGRRSFESSGLATPYAGDYLNNAIRKPRGGTSLHLGTTDERFAPSHLR
jgi:hypothetical protein